VERQNKRRLIVIVWISGYILALALAVLLAALVWIWALVLSSVTEISRIEDGRNRAARMFASDLQSCIFGVESEPQLMDTWEEWHDYRLSADGTYDEVSATIARCLEPQGFRVTLTETCVTWWSSRNLVAREGKPPPHLVRSVTIFFGTDCTARKLSSVRVDIYVDRQWVADERQGYAVKLIRGEVNVLLGIGPACRAAAQYGPIHGEHVARGASRRTCHHGHYHAKSLRRLGGKDSHMVEQPIRHIHYLLLLDQHPRRCSRTRALLPES